MTPKNLKWLTARVRDFREALARCEKAVASRPDDVMAIVERDSTLRMLADLQNQLKEAKASREKRPSRSV